MKKLSITIIVIIAIVVGWYLVSPIWRVQSLQEKSPLMEGTDAVVLTQANFEPRAHDVSGSAILIQKDGGKILHFKNFETINGPNLHIYLSADLNSRDFVDLGAIRATKGSVNYEIPDGIDTEKYRHVLVWCVPFRTLFSSASLYQNVGNHKLSF